MLWCNGSTETALFVNSPCETNALNHVRNVIITVKRYCFWSLTSPQSHQQGSVELSYFTHICKMYGAVRLGGHPTKTVRARGVVWFILLCYLHSLILPIKQELFLSQEIFLSLPVYNPIQIG
jgi:hypothetical protein